MGIFDTDFLALVQDTKRFLDTHSDPIFASPSDTDYFRKLHKKKAPTPPKKIPAPIFAPKPPLEPEPVCEPAPEPIFLKSPPPPVPKAMPAPEPISKPTPLPEKLEIPAPLPPKGLKGLLAKIAPDLAILDHIPSDEIAKKISTRWKTKNQSAPITLLCYQEIPEQKALLEQIAKALDVTFGPARLISAESIEKEKQWDTLLSVPDLKLIVCCDYTLWQLTGLMQYYKEIPSQQTRMLKNKPLFLLPDLALYLKDPLLKRSLWKGLCQTIHMLPSS